MANNKFDWEIVGIFEEFNTENKSELLELFNSNESLKKRASLDNIESYLLDPKQYCNNNNNNIENLNHPNIQNTIILTRSWTCKLYILSGITGNDLSGCMDFLDNFILKNIGLHQTNQIFYKFKNLPDLLCFPISHCKFENLLGEKICTLIKKCIIHLFLDFGGNPNIILIAGTSGSGKSTISSYLASFLKVRYVISTDTIRHVLRSTEKYKNIKTLNCSTYEVHKYTNIQLTEENNCQSLKSPIILGYLLQSSLIENYIYEIIENLINNKKSIIVEGVHITPSLFERIQSFAFLKNVNLSTFLIYIQDPSEHIKRFQQRSKGVLNSKYNSNISNILEIQNYLINTIGKIPSVTSIDNTSNNIDKIVQENILKQVTIKF